MRQTHMHAAIYHRRVRTTGMLFRVARGVSRQDIKCFAGGMQGLYAIIS